MKTMFSILFFFLFIDLFGQNFNQINQPFIIKGQLSECQVEFIRFFYEDQDGIVKWDTFNFDKDGKFYFETLKILKPQKTSLQNGTQIQINNIFVAPGYNLTITGNAKDYATLFKTKRITGIGSESNAYRFILDSIISARNDTTKWYRLGENELLSFINKERELFDSVYTVVFSKKTTEDKYLDYFAKMVSLDNSFLELDKLLYYAVNNHFDYKKSKNFLENNFNKEIIDNLFNDEYMVSSNYKHFILTNRYLEYLLQLDYQKDTLLKDRKDYFLEKINNEYKGSAKDYTFYQCMVTSISVCTSKEKLNDCKEVFKPYMLSISNQVYIDSIMGAFSRKEAELKIYQTGQPAPKFTLKNNDGRLFGLDDFNGKVVYIDLWASWCGPCRAETPSLKRLYEKYKDDTRVVFISIAVNDKLNDWKIALEKDKPEWLQLYDSDGIVSKLYMAYAIPKFILIDKKGKIVNFDAPRPSSGEKIELLLYQELVK